MSLYKALIEFRDNETNPVWVKEADYDGIITIKKVSSKSRGKSLVILKFSGNEYFDLFRPGDDGYTNNDYLFSVVFDRYYRYDYVFMDSYSSDEEFRYGGIYHLNDVNLSMLKECVLIMNPSFDKTTQDLEFWAIEFIKLFESESDEIGADYINEYDEALVTGLKEYLLQKVCGVFDTYGIFESKCGYEYFTTVNDIIKIWDESGANENDKFLDMIKKFIKNKDLEIDGDLFEDYHSYFDSRNFDSDAYNRNSERILDSLKDRLLEEDELGFIEKNREILRFLDELGIKVDTFHSFPKEKSFGSKYGKIFRVRKIENGLLTVQIKKQGGNYETEQFKIPLDEFKKLLYNPELFD